MSDNFTVQGHLQNDTHFVGVAYPPNSNKKNTFASRFDAFCEGVSSYYNRGLSFILFIFCVSFSLK